MYKALKTASWQIDLTTVVDLVEGQPVDVPDHVASMMIDAGYIKESKPVQENKELKPVTANKSVTKPKSKKV
jgi:hypothetical protein